MNRFNPALAGLLATTALCMPAVAQDVEAALDSGTRNIRLAQAAQERIDEVVGETRDLESRYLTVLKEIDGLEVYNQLVEAQLEGQQSELTDLDESMKRVTVIERQIMPLMMRMIAGLEQFVDLDVPFLLDERRGRIRDLESLMARSDVTVAEKFRRLTEAFQIEIDYGRTMLAYKGELELDGGAREVNFLRIGRAGLFYQTVDAGGTGVWNQDEREWQPLDSGQARNQVRQGLRMADKRVAPDLLLLPVAAPETAS